MNLLMAANWKMNKTQAEAAHTLSELLSLVQALPAERELAVFAPFTLLSVCNKALKDSRIRLGGQNCFPAAEGAFTGEISPKLLQDSGCELVLAGHSERRSILGESDEFIGRKVNFALKSGLDVILCVGETLQERERGALIEVLSRQLTAGLVGVSQAVTPERISIAYEPVWAIGTGKIAGPQEIIDAHLLIRSLLSKILPTQFHEMRILYGGSVKPENTANIINLDNVNGVLVGGASLQADSFSRIAMAN